MRLFAVLVAPFLLFAALACGGGSTQKDTSPAPVSPTQSGDATAAKEFAEACAECGARWSARILREPGKVAVAVEITNTGERGALQIVGDRTVLLFFTKSQADVWKERYPTAWAEGKLSQLGVEVGYGSYALRPVAGTQLPASLALGESWQGRFEYEGTLQPETVAVIFVLNAVQYEKTPPGQAPAGGWSTIDPTHPFISLTDAVLVQALPTVTPVPPSVKFQVHLTPGAAGSTVPTSHVYRFQLTGFDTSNLQGNMTVTPALPGSPDGQVRAFNRPSPDVLDIPIPLNVAANHYVLTLKRSSDGTTVSVEFDHRP